MRHDMLGLLISVQKLPHHFLFNLARENCDQAINVLNKYNIPESNYLYMDEHGDNLLTTPSIRSVKLSLLLLTKNGINYNHVNNHGINALIASCYNGAHPVVLELLKKNDINWNAVDDQGNNALLAHVSGKYNCSYISPKLNILYNDNMVLIGIKLLDFVDINKDGENILTHCLDAHYSVNTWGIKLIEFLITFSKINYDHKCNEILNILCGVSEIDRDAEPVALIILEKNIINYNHIHEGGLSILMYACYYNCHKLVAKLLEHVDINYNNVDNYGRTALSLCYTNYNFDDNNFDDNKYHYQNMMITQTILKLLDFPDINYARHDEDIDLMSVAIKYNITPILDRLMVLDPRIATDNVLIKSSQNSVISLYDDMIRA
jgi:ankyrin repeat protein